MYRNALQNRKGRMQRGHRCRLPLSPEPAVGKRPGLRMFGLVIFVLVGCTRGPDADVGGKIRKVMDAQVEAWNRGDIESFLAGYDDSPQLLFASRGTFSRGWRNVLERYRKAYPTGEMGTLSFDGIEVHPIGADAAWVVGEWLLKQDDSSPHGVFTLIFKKTPDGWRIIHDHSSGVPEPEKAERETQ